MDKKAIRDYMDKKPVIKKRGRRKYIEDYKLVGKELVYTGDWYVFTGTAAGLRRHNYITAGLSVCCFAVLLMIGFLHMSGIYRFYVLAPYVLSLMLSVVCVIDAFKLWNAGEKLNREQYERGAVRIVRASVILAVTSAVSTLGEAAFLIFVGVYLDLRSELTFLIGAAAVTAAAVLMHFQTRRIEWRKTK